MRKVSPKLQRNHIGLDGFIWAVGVVEDRNDPLFLGRCKVRYFGWHIEDKDLMPTKYLPWSYALTDLDSGRNVVGPKEGDWVVGFFRDGIVAQEPVMIGVVPGIPEIEADPSRGFFDPRTAVLAGHQVPREPLSFPIQHDDGSGSELHEMGRHSNFPQNEPADPLLRYVDQKEATTNRFERNEHIDQTLVEIKKKNIDIGQRDVPVAIHPNSQVGTDRASDGDDFTEEETKYDAKYPYNHAYYSEGGHLVEIDDTPGLERMHWFHRSGTFKEIHPIGLVVEKIVDDQYHIVLKSRWTHIEAMEIETVDWNKKLYVNKDKRDGYNYDVTIGEGGNYNVTVRRGEHNKYIMEGDENTRIKFNRYYLIEDSEYGQIKKDKFILIENDYDVHVYGYTNIITHNNATITALKNLNLNATHDLNIKCGGDLTIQCGGNMYTKVNKNSYTVCDGSVYRLAANLWELAYNFINRFTRTMFDISLFHYLNWAGRFDAVSPALALNYQVPALPVIDPPIEMGPGPPDLLSPAAALTDGIVNNNNNNVQQDSVKTFSMPDGLYGADHVKPIEMVERELTARFLEESIRSPIVEMDAPKNTIWWPVNMDGTAVVMFPESIAAPDKTNIPQCSVFDGNNEFVETAKYVKSEAGADIFKLKQDGLKYVLSSKINKVKMHYNGYSISIPEPAKMNVGNGTPAAKVNSDQRKR